MPTPTSITQCLLGLGLAAALLPAAAQTTVLINPGDQIEGDRLAVFNTWKNALDASLRKVGAANVQTRFSSDATADLSATRANTFDVIVAPAPTIGSAVRHGYVPVMGLADAPLIASRVERVIYAVESHGIRASMVKTALGRLISANARVIGGVLTKFEARKAHYGYGYEYGYSYGRRDEANA